MLRKRLIILILFLFCLPAGRQGLPCFGEDRFVPGQMLVKFRPDTVEIREKSGVGVFSLDRAEIRSSSINALNAKHKIKKIRSFVSKERKFKKLRSGQVVELPDLSQIFLLEFPKDIDVMTAVGEYRNDPSVEFAEPNYIKKILAPNDPKYITGSSPDNDPNQWGLYKIGLSSVESGNSGWNIETGTNEVKIAVIDTGVDYTHEDLKNNVASLEGYDFANGDSDPMDDHGHGTHCSGIIGADTDNGVGVAGVNWHCTIIPIKFLDSSGNGSTADEISSIIWAVSKEADVISMSFGAGASDPFELNALSYAATKDCVLVAAAGNENSQSPDYPGGYNIVISVAATDPYDVKASYSNYGSWVKVSAPGGEQYTEIYRHGILSTLPPHVTDNPGDLLYDYWQGTSMATPFVAGLAALMRAKYPTMSAAEVSQKIINTADNIDAKNQSKHRGKLGKGRINALAALTTLYASITSPANGSTVDAAPVEIRGSASGEGFGHYTVEWGMGESPSVFMTIATSLTPEVNTLLATLDASGMNNSYVTVKLTVFGLSTSVSTETQATFHVGPIIPPPSLARAEYGPNPFNPGKGPIMIMYELTSNDDTYIYFYDVSGGLICRKFYPSGSIGGSQGINRVYWDGINDFGETVANGVYLFRISSGNKTIDKGKIIVLK